MLTNDNDESLRFNSIPELYQTVILKAPTVFFR